MRKSVRLRVKNPRQFHDGDGENVSLASIIEADYTDLADQAEGMPEFKSQEELDTYIAKLESDMREAAKRFEFEKAAKLRDTIRELRTKEFLFA